MDKTDIVGRQSGIPTSHQRLTRYLEVTGSRSSAGWKTWPDYPDSIHVIVIIVTNLENLLRRHPSITGLVETNHTWLVYLPMSCGLARRIKNRLALACECCFGTTVLVPWVNMILALSLARTKTQSGSWVDRCKSLICSWHSASFAVLILEGGGQLYVIPERPPSLLSILLLSMEHSRSHPHRVGPFACTKGYYCSIHSVTVIA